MTPIVGVLAGRTTVDLERLPERLSEQVGKVRDRTAEAVSGDGGSVLREVGKLGRHLDRVEDTLTTRLEDLSAALAETQERVADVHEETAGTTWPRRLFWMMVGAGTGAAAAYLADPDRGETRRQELVDQASARATALSEDLRHRIEHVEDELTSDPVVPEDARTLVDQPQGG